MPCTMTNRPRKKEDRDPVDLGKGLGDPQRLPFSFFAVVLKIVEQHQHRGAEQRDRAGLQIERPGPRRKRR